MNRELIPAKFKAAGIHFILSLLAFLGLLGVSMTLWYPDILFQADGGWQGLRIVVLVDVVLGPLLTFIVFNPHKPLRETMLDLSVIILLQLAALGYGVYTTWSQKPSVVVLLDQVLYPLTAKDWQGPLNDPKQLQRYAIGEQLPLVYAHIPLDREVLDEVNRQTNELGIPVYAQTHLYQAPQAIPDAMNGIDFEQTQDPNWLDLYQAWLEENALEMGQVRVIPMRSRYQRSYQVFDRAGHWLGGFVYD